MDFVSPKTSGSVRQRLVLLVVAFTALGGLFLAGFGGVASVGAAVAPAATQCDPPAYPTGAGFEVSCTITIDNTVTSTGLTSSSITATACLAAAGVLPPFGCTTVVTTSNQLVSTVNQCNGVADGGGSNVTCSVSVINTIPAGDELGGCDGQSVHRLRDRRWHPTHNGLRAGGEYDRCHCDAMQRIGDRRGRIDAGQVH